MVTTPRIAAVATSTPWYCFDQITLLRLAGYCDGRCTGFFTNSQIDKGHLVRRRQQLAKAGEDIGRNARCSRAQISTPRRIAHFSWRRIEERDCMHPANDGSKRGRNVMRVTSVVLMLLAFLGGCAARPVIRDQQSASVFQADQNSGSQCAGPNWNACR
jgi:hypothetical protein